MNRLTLLDAAETVLGQAEGTAAAALTVERAYQPGDHLVLESTEKYCYASISALVSPAYLYLPEGRMVFSIPTRVDALRAYAPLAFRGRLHTYTLAPAPIAPQVYRNLALNPLCEHAFCGGYPFVRDDSPMKHDSITAPRNVIDGVTLTGQSGLWPHQGWMPDEKESRITIELGREVEADRMLLTVCPGTQGRCWRQASVTLSDGFELTFPLEPSTRAQNVEFEDTHMIDALTLHGMTEEGAAGSAPALMEWEVWGRG